MHDYKKTGSIRAGFQYQDLVAIEILINFYRERSLYVWVRLEAEGPEFKSIDDVVAYRPDGLYELIQVKFTVDPTDPDNELSWAWLTENGGTKKSWLQKWARTTLLHKEADTLAQAVLKTNRIPDATFAKCLEDTKVKYDLVSSKDRTKIEAQLGSPDIARSFFESFEFIHSQPILDDFEKKLWLRVASDTDSGGWALFQQQVRRWSMVKKKPSPDGKIKYIHLRQAFAVGRSKPISQDFVVPTTYSVPDTNFSGNFLKEITDSDGLTVLWGPPGCGKSTYLSYCAEHIDSEKTVCIRHHYFLGLGDKSQGRFHYHAIARSLGHQIKEVIPDLNKSQEDLNKFLEAAANQLRNDGQRLIVIIDGLDHVWRDHRDHEDMEELFGALLPLPQNIRLVVGTQKVANENLPTKLLQALPKDEWTELPLMSQAAIQKWLCLQNEEGRLDLKIDEQQTLDQAIGVIAKAFHNISQGLPLHLIYSFEAIAHAGNAITAEDVEALPACPTGDIRDYYRSLWDRIGLKARIILNVLAGLKFSLPLFALQDCFGSNETDFIALDRIGHLLDYQETEVRPFHGSLFAFVRDRPEHKFAFAAYASSVLAWLESRAPEYWRWAWLWITKAQLGDSSDLLAEPSREWALNSLVSGYPVKQIIVILSHAEKAALTAFNLPHLLSIHLLKMRAINGLEFQADEWSLFSEISISLSDDQYVKSLLHADVRHASADTLLSIVRNADEPNRSTLVQAVIHELNLRAKRCQGDRMEVVNEQYNLAKCLVIVASYKGSDGAQRAVTFAKQFANPGGLIAAYAQESMYVSNFDNVFEVGKYWSDEQLNRYILAALCFEGLTPSTKPTLKALKHPAIRCLALLKGEVAKHSQVKKDISRLFLKDSNIDSDLFGDIRRVAYDIFFTALAEELSGGIAYGWSTIPSDAEEAWLSGAIRSLEQLAGGIAQKWKKSQQWVTLQDIYTAFELERPVSGSHAAQRNFIAIRLAMFDIVVDLCTIAKGLDPQALISVSDIESVVVSPFWIDELWLNIFIERRLALHTSNAAKAFVKRMESYLDTNVTDFSERAMAIINLAKFATDHNLGALAKSMLWRASRCLLGYGGHKDFFALEVLDSLKMLERNRLEVARKTIFDLAGEFEAITDYTDGDGTHYIREEFYEVIAEQFPERVPSCYAYQIQNEKWSYAETLSAAFIQTERDESNTEQALFESYIVPSEITALEKMSKSNPKIEKILASVHRKIGKSNKVKCVHDSGAATEDVNSVETNSEGEIAEESSPNPHAFPPGQLEEYLRAIPSSKRYTHRKEFVIEWLKHWEASDCAVEALANLTDTISEKDYRLNCDDALDTAFEISLRAQGRSKAFFWLVRAHIAKYGWLRFPLSSHEEAQTRMRLVAQYYPQEWHEFIRQTARPNFPVRAKQDEIVIGLSRLVYFLIEVGELEMAHDYTMEMVRIFKDELSDQPIEVPSWAR